MGRPRTYVALLRGINVGGKHMIPMKDLSAIFTAVGCSNVRTYIQSGNVIFSAPVPLVKKLPDLVAEQIAARFGYHVPVILRDAEQLARTIQSNPFLQAGRPGKTLYVFFLANLPDPLAIGKLDPHRSPSGAFHVLDQEIFLHLPDHVAGSKLTNAYFDTTLSTKSTARNWNTVLKIFEMMQD